MLYHHSVDTHGGNRGECTVNTEGNKEVRGREGGRDEGRERGKGGKEILKVAVRDREMKEKV